MKRFICTYANARLEPSREGAIFQRGGYYVVDLSGKKDPYRYGIFLRDSMLGMTGTIANAKRFCQAVYLRYPMEKDVSEVMDYSDLSKKYRVKARKENKPKKEKSKKADDSQQYNEMNILVDELRQKYRNLRKFSVDDFNSMIAVRDEILKKFPNDKYLQTLHDDTISNMVVGGEYTYFPTKKIESLDELKSKKTMRNTQWKRR